MNSKYYVDGMHTLGKKPLLYGNASICERNFLSIIGPVLRDRRNPATGPVLTGDTNAYQIKDERYFSTDGP